MHNLSCRAMCGKFDDVGQATVAPLLQGLRAQAPSPSSTEGTYAVSKLFDITQRSLERDCDTRCTATRRCPPARRLSTVAASVARRALARCCQGCFMEGRFRYDAAHGHGMQGRPRNEPKQ